MKKGCYVVAIGASAGGTEALTSFFKNMPVNNHIAFVVIPHLKTGCRSYLDEIIGKVTAIPVIRVTKNMIVLSGKIYLLAEERIMTIKGNRLYIRQRRPDEIINSAIDIFLISLAVEFKKKAVAVILSGMGSDGVKGVQAINCYEGLVLVQDPATTLYKSMPNAAININHAAEVLPPEQMAIKLAKLTGQTR
jgi:chemotaxis response regulator CheB